MNRRPVPAGKGMFSLDTVFRMVVEGMFIGSLALVAYTAGNSTMCFAVLSLAQLVHTFNMRSNRSLTELSLWGNKKLLFSVAFCILLQCSVIIVPALQPVFHTASLSSIQWGMVITLSLLPIPLVELEKHLSFSK
jgi:Ca2+-transporting ATPase